MDKPGLAWEALRKISLGRLPGDFTITRSGFAFSFPLAASLVASVTLTLLFSLFKK